MLSGAPNPSAPPSLRCVVYVSSATRLFTDPELQMLLEQSRERNARQGITGMLLYKDGNFLQLIEGPEPAVRALHARIGTDTRHRHVITVFDEMVHERQCPDWSMGYVPAERLPRSVLSSFTPFLTAEGDARRARTMHGPLGDALTQFREHVR